MFDCWKQCEGWRWLEMLEQEISDPGSAFRIRKLQNWGKYFTNAMAVVVLIDAYCTCWDIDARAEGKRAGLVAQTISDVCLALYTLELAMFFLVSGWVLLKDWVVPWRNYSMAQHGCNAHSCATSTAIDTVFSFHTVDMIVYVYSPAGLKIMHWSEHSAAVEHRTQCDKDRSRKSERETERERDICIYKLISVRTSINTLTRILAGAPNITWQNDK